MVQAVTDGSKIDKSEIDKSKGFGLRDKYKCVVQDFDIQKNISKNPSKESTGLPKFQPSNSKRLQEFHRET